MLVYFFNLFSTLKYLRPFPNGDMWNPQRFTCSWSWMISRKAHRPWAPSLAGFPQWLGVSKSRCFLRVQFPQKVFGGWECWLVFGPKVAWDFLVAQKFWRRLFAEDPIFGHFSHFGQCTTAEGQPEKLHLKVVGLGFVWGTRLNQRAV